MTPIPPSPAQHFHLDFQPIGRRGSCLADKTLLDAARELGVALHLRPQRRTWQGPAAQP